MFYEFMEKKPCLSPSMEQFLVLPKSTLLCIKSLFVTREKCKRERVEETKIILIYFQLFSLSLEIIVFAENKHKAFFVM